MTMFSSPTPQLSGAATGTPASAGFPRRIAMVSSLPAIHRQSAWRILLAQRGLEELVLCGPDVEIFPDDAERCGATVRIIAATTPCDPQIIARIREGQPDILVIVGDAKEARAYHEVCPVALRLELGEGGQRGRSEVLSRGSVVWCRVFDARQPAVVIDEAVAPIYSRDTLGRVESRAWELGIRMVTQALHGRAGGVSSASRNPPVRPRRAQPATAVGRSPHLGRAVGKRVHLRRLAKSIVYSLLMVLWRPVRDLVRTAVRRHPVRIFTFHRISDLCRDGMTVSPTVFGRQVAYIARHHELISVPRALALAGSNHRLTRPVAALTFDDGYRSVYEFARPMLRGHGLPACCFLTTDLVGTSERFAHDRTNPVVRFLDVMSWHDVCDLKDDGWEIGGHSASHRRLSKCDAATIAEELSRAREAVRRELGLECTTMAYPFGGRDDITADGLRLVREVGYTSCFSDYGGENRPPSDPYHVRRIEMGGDHETLAWQARAHGIDLGRWRRVVRRRRSAGAPPVPQ